MIDLHVHSKFSDGSNTIEEIIEQAKELNLKQIAITDHNNLEGSILAHQLAEDLTIVGCELSVGYQDNELHLLGYFPKDSDYKNTSYIIKLGEINKSVATAEMVERLNEAGYSFKLNELGEFGSGTINRVHICRCLMKHGYISSVAEGFEKLVGDNCFAYVKREYVAIDMASKAIKDDGGIAVLAHPYNYKQIKNIEKLLDDNLNYIDGIECYHYSANKQQSEMLRQYALAHHKIITGGSDYHGVNKPNVFLNMMEVDDKYQLSR